MAKTGGARQGAGRPAGTLNRRSVEILAAVADGLSPIEFMLNIMRDEAADADSRAWAAEKAAPYFHPKPAPMPRLVTLDLPKTDTAEGVRSALARIVEATAAGQIAPAEAQSLVAVIEAQRRAIEAVDHEERIAAIEEQIAKEAGHTALGRALGR